MTELAERRPKAPKPIAPSWLFACFLELGFVLTFSAHRSWFGLLLCCFYARFSACWALTFRGDE